MPLPNGLHQRKGVWQLRIGVPADLHHLYPGADAYRASLRTTDRAIAITRAHVLIAEHRAKFDQLRTSEAVRRAPPLVPITPELEAYLSQQLGWVTLTFDDVVRITPDAINALVPGIRYLTSSDDPPTPLRLGDDPTRWHRLQQASLDLAKADLASGRLDKAQAAADADLKAIGVRVDWSDTAARLSLMRIARAQVRSYQLAVERGQGEPHDAPPKPASPTVPAHLKSPETPTTTLRDVVPDWVARTRAKDNAKLRTDKALTLWEQAVGVIPLDKITRATGANFVAFLLAKDRPFGTSTAANHAACINALMNVAAKIGKIERNALDLSFKIVDAKEREGWTREELHTIFDPGLFGLDPGPQPLGVDASDARLWLLQLLWSGAAAGEIAQARVEDVQTRDGILCLRITKEAGTLKTDSRVRWLPIAQSLRPLYLAQVEARRAEGKSVLFPSFHRRGKTSPADMAGRWFLQFRKAQGLPMGGLQASHRFRHTVRTRLAALNVSPDLGDQLTGPAPTGSTGRRVYTGLVGTAVMATVVEKLGWEWPKSTR